MIPKDIHRRRRILQGRLFDIGRNIETLIGKLDGATEIAELMPIIISVERLEDWSYKATTDALALSTLVNRALKEDIGKYYAPPRKSE